MLHLSCLMCAREKSEQRQKVEKLYCGEKPQPFYSDPQVFETVQEYHQAIQAVFIKVDNNSFS